MTKVRVTSMFHDKTDYSRIFEVGHVYDFSDNERVRTIVERGLGVVEEEEPEEIKKADDKHTDCENHDDAIVKAENPKVTTSKRRTTRKK